MAFEHTGFTAMDLFDAIFLGLVFMIAVHILDNGDWGGGKRAKIPIACPQLSS